MLAHPAALSARLQAIQGARSSCAIVLTTHYMEEAEGLCDRLGVFVGGRLRCIGSPKVRISYFEARWYEARCAAHTFKAQPRVG